MSDLAGIVPRMVEPSYVRATRAGYDAVAADYAEWVSDHLAAKPLDRALLATFAELVHADGARPVGDFGCGSGRVTAHLRCLGLSAFGVDLSPAMVAVAQRAYPDLRFDEGSLTAVNAADGALGGIVAWYSIIHTPPEELPVVFAEFHRVLAPGGHLLLAFQVGDEPRTWRRHSAMRCRSTSIDSSQIESHSGWVKPGLPCSPGYCASPTRLRRSSRPTYWPGNRRRSATSTTSDRGPPAVQRGRPAPWLSRARRG
jgi:SAM-dependent methyltransferase